MDEDNSYKCPKCDFEYKLPEIRGAGYTFWTCPECGIDDGVHVSMPIDKMLSEEEIHELKRKEKTFCSLIIKYTGTKDIPKFKKYDPKLAVMGNKKLLTYLSSVGGIVKQNFSLQEAEQIKREAESHGLTVEINV